MDNLPALPTWRVVNRSQIVQDFFKVGDIHEHGFILPYPQKSASMGGRSNVEVASKRSVTRMAGTGCEIRGTGPVDTANSHLKCGERIDMVLKDLP